MEAAAQLVNGSFGCSLGLIGFTSDMVVQMLKTPGRISERREAFDLELVLAAAATAAEQKEGSKEQGFGPLFLAKFDSEYTRMKQSSVKGLKEIGAIEKPFERSLRLIRLIARTLHNADIITQYQELMALHPMQWEKAIASLPASVGDVIPGRPDPQDAAFDLHALLFPS